MTNRMTNVNALDLAIATLTEQGFDSEALTKLSNIRNSYANKNAKSGERKPTPTQLENEKIKEEIVTILESGNRYTATEIVKALSTEISVSRVSALLRQLRMANIVERTEEKGRAYFTLA